MKQRLVSILIFAIIISTSIFYFIIALALRILSPLFDRRRKILHLYTCFWGAFYMYIMPAWPTKVEGRNKIRKDATLVYVSNHQSQLDILALFRLYTHFKWVSKIEIFKIPLIGWNMSLNGYIKLRRGDKESIAQMMTDAEKVLKEGSSIFMFPEGTRSPDGNMKDFKLGAFILAKKLQLSIQPVIVEGTRFALPKYSVNFHGKHPIKVRVLDEIPYEDFAHLSEEETAKKVWNYMNGELKQLQSEMAS